MDRKRLARFVLLAAALLVAAVLSRHWPKERTVHYVLGDAAPLVEEVDARWAPAASPAGDDWAREATFRFERGGAPRVVSQELRLTDGEYTVEVEVGRASRPPERVRRRVEVDGDSLSIDLADGLLASPSADARGAPRGSR